MNKKVYQWMAAGLAALMMVQVYSSVRPAEAQPQAPIDPQVESYILERTVQIKLFAPLNASEDGSPEEGIKSYVMAKGLGTVADWNGERVIVTHNHWGEMLSDAEYVTIHDAYGTLLIKLSMNEFTSLIRYTDPGTLILAAPFGMPDVAADLNSQAEVVSGDIVYVVRQDPQNPDQVKLVAASMLRMKDYKGQSVYKLAILDEGVIVPGDSGGGNWADGKLVGNTWASFFNTVKLPFSPETSLVAPLPEGV